MMMAIPQKVKPLLSVRMPAPMVSKGMIEHKTRITHPQNDRAKTSDHVIRLDTCVAPEPG
jgi:hypothetical protein